MLPNVYCEANTTLRAKAEKDTTPTKISRPVSLMITDSKIGNKRLTNRIYIHKKDYKPCASKAQ